MATRRDDNDNKEGDRKDPELPLKIDRAIFPGFQGGPHDHQTASIAIALYEAAQPSFKKYAAQIVKKLKSTGNNSYQRRFEISCGSQ